MGVPRKASVSNPGRRWRLKRALSERIQSKYRCSHKTFVFPLRDTFLKRLHHYSTLSILFDCIESKAM